MGYPTPKSDNLDSKASFHGHCLFYSSLEATDIDHVSLSGGYSESIWWPSTRRPWPPGVFSLHTRLRFAFRWLLDRVGLFANREVGALCIHHGRSLVHYSGFT